MSQRQRRLAAIMFTDMVGYTALGQKNESLSLALVEEQRKLLRPIFGRHDGREIKTIGDAFLVEFPSALEAVRAAYDVQRVTREFNMTMADEKRVHLRVGVHLGDVVESEGDISGDAVNVASRIESLAEDGGVCLTRQVYDHVQGKFDLPLASLGSKSLKNVGAPLEIYKIVMPWEDKDASSSRQFDERRIAVLPFASMSPDPNDAYFADGMTEELISTISKIGELQVISRTSVMRYKGAAVPVSQIGRDLSVGSVLEGSVRKAGNKVRITAQLIEVRGDKHVWSQSYDREMTDVFAIQGDIAEQVAESLKVRLLAGQKQSLRKQATPNPEAYTLYLKGRFYWNERTEEGTKKAIRYFEEAARVDPQFAMAYSGLADSYNIMSDYGWMAPAKALPLAKSNATKALEIDDMLAEAHASLGITFSHYAWDFIHAEIELRRAIELKPNYAPAHHWYALTEFYMRKYAVFAAEDRIALALDPFSRTYNMSTANIFLLEGKPLEAIRRHDELLEAYPDFGALNFWKSTALIVAGKFEEAIAAARKLEAADGGSPNSRMQVAWAFAAAGKRKEAEDIVSAAIVERERSFVSPTIIAGVKLALGQKDEGYAWLEKALAERDPSLLYFNAFPWTKEYRADPRWAAIEVKLGFASSPD